MNKLFSTLAMLACLALSACASPATETPSAAADETSLAEFEGVRVTLVSFGAPMAGEHKAQALYTVLNGTTHNTTIEASLPDELKTVLQEALAASPQDVYVILYAGPQPSSGYALQIDDVKLNGNDLQITYRIAPPPPSTGAATVITHPYVLLRVSGPKAADLNVTFTEAK